MAFMKTLHEDGGHVFPVIHVLPTYWVNCSSFGVEAGEVTNETYQCYRHDDSNENSHRIELPAASNYQVF